MVGFLNLTEKIKDYLEGSLFVNKVTYGDITEVDMDKETNFPLSHFMIDSVSYQPNVMRYTMSLLCMDIVDVNKDETDAQTFRGESNQFYVFNTQLAVITKLMDELSSGDIHADSYHLIGEPTMEPFVDRFANQLAGWSVTFTVDIVNDMSCG